MPGIIKRRCDFKPKDPNSDLSKTLKNVQITEFSEAQKILFINHEMNPKKQ